MPEAVLLVLQGISAAITAAPQVEAVIKSGKDMIAALFSAGLITKDTQDALHAWVDLHAQLDAQGIVGPAWTVEADPK